MDRGTAAARLLAHERALTLAALGLVVALAWFLTIWPPGQPDSQMGMDMPMAMPVDWTLRHALVVLAMWWIMMIAMMLPSAAPMVLLFSALKRSRGEEGDLPMQQAAFVLGYLAIWAVFSLAAVGLHWLLEWLGLISPEMRVVNSLIAAAVLIAAGLYQLTPIKQVCLTYCRSPAVLLARFWRPGTWGAFNMGLQHGRFCLGCCTFLMLLLFVGGVMNVWWIVGLAAYVAAEKLLPAGEYLRLLTGVALAASGVLVAIGEIV